MKSLVAISLLGAWRLAIAQDAPSRSVWDGVYTQEQAQRGAVIL